VIVLEGVPRCKWHVGGKRWRFGWLVAENGTDAAVLDVRGREFRVLLDQVEKA
jgi:hypothetical protein